jgi:hypothetical protein
LTGFLAILLISTLFFVSTETETPSSTYIYICELPFPFLSFYKQERKKMKYTIHFLIALSSALVEARPSLERVDDLEPTVWDPKIPIWQKRGADPEPTAWNPKIPIWQKREADPEPATWGPKIPIWQKRDAEDLDGRCVSLSYCWNMAS